jgi:hypothetical protein
MCNYQMMNRRNFLRACTVSGLLPAGVAATSHRASAHRADGLATSDSTPATVSLDRGRRVVNQPQYDDGTIPDTPPSYKSETVEVDPQTVDEITAGRALSAELLDRVEQLSGTQLDFDPSTQTVSVSRQSTAEGLRVFVDCPPGTDTDRIETTIDRIIDRIGPETINARLPDHVETVDIQVRNRPTERLEVDCKHSFGRFADAKYRTDGIAMGAAARSETVGKIASTGFRGLRNGRAVVVTTAHTFETNEDQPPAELRGAELYQSRRPHSVGRCHAVDGNLDAAAVAIDTDTYPSRYLAAPRGNSYNDEPIVGTASWSVLEAYHAEGRPIYKQGAVSGRCKGRITELSEANDGHRELGVDIHSAGGDSGGPYFISTDDGLLVAGIHKGVRSVGSQRRAVFVGSILDSLGIDLY